MKNRTTMVVLGACSCFLAALGADSLKATSFAPAGIGAVDNPNVDGVCKIKVNGQDLSSIQMTISGLLPNTTYGILCDGDGFGLATVQAFTTNPQGHGAWHMNSMPQGGQLGSYCDITVFIWDNNEDANSFWEVTAEEARATGRASL
jgi:hypothetical protein